MIQCSLIALLIALSGCTTNSMGNECRISCEKCEGMEMSCTLQGDKEEVGGPGIPVG